MNIKRRSTGWLIESLDEWRAWARESESRTLRGMLPSSSRCGRVSRGICDRPDGNDLVDNREANRQITWIIHLSIKSIEFPPSCCFIFLDDVIYSDTPQGINRWGFITRVFSMGCELRFLLFFKVIYNFSV